MMVRTTRAELNSSQCWVTIESMGWRRDSWERAPLRVAAKLFAQLAESELTLPVPVRPADLAVTDR